MNFTQEIKRELIRFFPSDAGSQSAFLAAVLDTGGTRTAKDITFVSENEDTARFFLSVFDRLTGESMEVIEAIRDPKRGKSKLTLSYSGEHAEEILKLIYGYGEEEPQDENYLRGAFLAGGSCTLPHEGKKTGYHLEVVFDSELKAIAFQELLDRFQVIGSLIRRGEKYVIYLKSREAISDFLAAIGAMGALKKLESVSAAREESNNENRRGNCYAGNADRSMTASAEQAFALGKLKKDGKFVLLSELLRETAQARLDEPELSLSELAQKLGVSKSCLNHRLRKLMEISEKECR